MLRSLVPGGVFLLNSPYGPQEVWDKLPNTVQKQLIAKKARFYVIDGYAVARDAGMGSRVNTIMQTCFFAISGILPKEEAIAAIKKAIKKTYGAKGEEIVKKNFEAVDMTLANLHEVVIPSAATSAFDKPPVVSDEAPEFVKTTLAKIIANEGDDLPVSAMPVDGTFPTATAQWEKRNIALEIPVWDEKICIQCGKCALACPHAAIRIKVYDPALLKDAPATFKSVDFKGQEFKGMKYTVQIAPEDCTGCAACAWICPAKDKSNVKHKSLDMADQMPLRAPERDNYEFFLNLPEVDRSAVKIDTVKGSQFLQPLFEYSGACSGCGETPYVKLLSQLFGDRAVIANATGCSSIYGGNLPTTPWAVNRDGRGPAWSNSLFEDTAEFGLGFRLTIDKHQEYALELISKMAGALGSDLADAIRNADQKDEAGIAAQRKRVEALKAKLAGMETPEAKNLLSVADMLVKKSVWILGGDGWAYDIGYGGLDHVLASGRNVNVLVLDTEVYSNTGGQCSKATPMGAVAKFAASGKPLPKKDLGMIAMTYGNIYVARVAMGASDAQTVRAFLEAEAYDGPSLIIAYSHCIAHGFDLVTGLGHQKDAVECGAWPLFRFNPAAAKEGKNPFKLDSRAPKIHYSEYAMKETRFKMLTKSHPEAAKGFMELGDQLIRERWRMYEHFASLFGTGEPETPPKA
jgi:pyruvate-ferredoxin/flavodoxin oxidoreductase